MQGKSHCTEAQNLQPFPTDLVLLLRAQPRIRSCSRKLSRELDLQGCAIIPVNILLPLLNSVLIAH